MTLNRILTMAFGNYVRHANQLNGRLPHDGLPEVFRFILLQDVDHAELRGGPFLRCEDI